MTTDPTDGKPGLRIESASSIIMRSQIHDHFSKFALVIRTDRAAGQSTVTELANGLAGAVSLVIAGGHGSRSDVIEATIKQLRGFIDRDLQHLARNG